MRNVNVPPPICEGDMARKRNTLTHPKDSEYDPLQRIQSLLANFARCVLFRSSFSTVSIEGGRDWGCSK
jgi:hypothetical protein